MGGGKFSIKLNNFAESTIGVTLTNEKNTDMMKSTNKYLWGALLRGCLLALSVTLTACGGSDDEGGGGGTAISGKYIAQARKTSGLYASFTSYKAKGIHVDLTNNMVWLYDELYSNSVQKNPSVMAELKFPGFSGPGTWFSNDVGDYVVIRRNDGNSITMTDGTVLTATDNGVRYNGVEYYNQDYFNAHVGEWTGEPTEAEKQAEDVAVTLTVQQTSASRLLRQYHVTVTASGSNFTVKTISIQNVSGYTVFDYRNTSERSATFYVGLTGSYSSTIVGKVTTITGNTYTTDSRTLY